MGDLTAKGQAQGTTAYLLGLGLGLWYGALTPGQALSPLLFRWPLVHTLPSLWST